MARIKLPLLCFLAAWTIGVCVLAGRLDYWGDEIGSLEGASESVSAILGGRGADFHPPLYFLVLHAWQDVLGRGEHADRSMSAVVSALTILLTGVLAKRLGLGHPWGAATLLALSPFWLLFCGMARYYGLSSLLFVACLLSLLSAIRHGAWTRWVVYGVVVALGGYTNYLMLAAAIVTHGLLVVIRHRQCAARWVLSVGLAGVLLLPLAALVLSQTQGMIVWGERASFVGQWRTALLGTAYPLYVLAASETILPWRLWFSIPLLAASAYLVARSIRFGLSLVLAGGITVGVLTVLFIARSLPLVYLPSRLLFLAPVWAIMLTAGAERSGRQGVVALGVVLVGYGAGIWNLAQGRDYHNVTYLVPWRQVVHVIREDPEPDKLVVTTEEYPLLHYGQGLRFQLVRPGERVTKELAEKGAKVVWLVQRDRADRQRQGITSEAETWLNENYLKTDQLEYLKLTPMELRVRTFLLRREPSRAALTVTRFLRPW